MYITDFEYANKRLSDFGCMVCHLNTDASLKEADIGCDITFNTVKNNHSSIHSVTSSIYENVYTTTFDIMKITCNQDVEDIYLTPQEARAIIKWLNRREYNKFKLINSYNNVSDICYYGSFNVKQVMMGEKILGLSLTFTSNAPYGFGETNTLRFIVLDNKEENKTFTICGDSDELGIIYPSVKIKCFYDGDIKITNTTTENYVYVANCMANETIVIDGEHKVITSDNENHVTLPNDFNYEYFDIFIDDLTNENVYEVSAPCEITVSYSPIRKLGVY